MPILLGMSHFTQALRASERPVLVLEQTVLPPSPYREVERAMNALNNHFYPLSTYIHCYASPKRPDRRLVGLEERIAKVNAQVLLREKSPRQLLRAIEQLHCQIDRLAPRIIRYHGSCCRHPAYIPQI